MRAWNKESNDYKPTEKGDSYKGNEKPLTNVGNV